MSSQRNNNAVIGTQNHRNSGQKVVEQSSTRKCAKANQGKKGEKSKIYTL